MRNIGFIVTQIYLYVLYKLMFIYIRYRHNYIFRIYFTKYMFPAGLMFGVHFLILMSMVLESQVLKHGICNNHNVV